MSPHILALDVAGAPHRWINVRDAAHYYATDMIAWAVGTNEFVLRGGTQRATGLQSVIRASSIIAIKGKDFIVRHFDREPTLTKEMLLARDRHLCAYRAQSFRVGDPTNVCGPEQHSSAVARRIRARRIEHGRELGVEARSTENLHVRVEETV
jgi:hypothetical protein